MRWKLLLVASFVATIIGAGASLGIVYGLLRSGEHIFSPDIFILSTLLLPIAAVTFASIFVYRHTSRRRFLQAIATALLASILTLTSLIVASAFLARTSSKPDVIPTPAIKNA